MQRASRESSCITLISWPFSESEALRTAVITLLLPNHPYPLSVNLLPMFPPLLTATSSVLCARSLPNHRCLASLQATPLFIRMVFVSKWFVSKWNASHHRKYVCIPVVLLTYTHTYIHTYIRTWGLHATRLVASLPTRQLPLGLPNSSFTVNL